eukprot:2977745-Pyramimonas_sp.AAC.1
MAAQHLEPTRRRRLWGSNSIKRVLPLNNYPPPHPPPFKPPPPFVFLPPLLLESPLPIDLESLFTLPKYSESSHRCGIP